MFVFPVRGRRTPVVGRRGLYLILLLSFYNRPSVNGDFVSSLTGFITDHPCGEFLAHLTPTTQFVCHPYAFNTRTLDDVEIPLMASCVGLDIGSLALPIVLDLSTMPLQAACSEWYEYRINMYSHLKGVSPDDYEYLLDLGSSPVNDDDSPGTTTVAVGDDRKQRRRRSDFVDGDHDYAVDGIKNETTRLRRGVLTTVAKTVGKVGEHSIFKLIRPNKIYNTALTTYAKTFRGPTGKVLSETTIDAIKNAMRVERAGKDPMFKITKSKLDQMVAKYLLMPDVVVQAIDKSKLLKKPEKINLVREALAKYKPNKFA